jgi:hypothetical protein
VPDGRLLPGRPSARAENRQRLARRARDLGKAERCAHRLAQLHRRGKRSARSQPADAPAQTRSGRMRPHGRHDPRACRAAPPPRRRGGKGSPSLGLASRSASRSPNPHAGRRTAGCRGQRRSASSSCRLAPGQFARPHTERQGHACQSPADGRASAVRPSILRRDVLPRQPEGESRHNAPLHEWRDTRSEKRERRHQVTIGP